MIDRTLTLSATFSCRTNTLSPVTTMTSNGIIKTPNMNSLSQVSIQTRYVYSTLEMFGDSGATLVMLKVICDNLCLLYIF